MSIDRSGAEECGFSEIDEDPAFVKTSGFKVSFGSAIVMAQRAGSMLTKAFSWAARTATAAVVNTVEFLDAPALKARDKEIEQQTEEQQLQYEAAKKQRQEAAARERDYPKRDQFGSPEWAARINIEREKWDSSMRHIVDTPEKAMADRAMLDSLHPNQVAFMTDLAEGKANYAGGVVKQAMELAETFMNVERLLGTPYDQFAVIGDKAITLYDENGPNMHNIALHVQENVVGKTHEQKLGTMFGKDRGMSPKAMH